MNAGIRLLILSPSGAHGTAVEMSLEEFLTTVELYPRDAARLGSLAVGETIEVGGHPLPEYTVRRVS